MKKIFLLIFIFFYKFSYANSINNIKLLNNDDYKRIVFSLNKAPKYFVDNKENHVNVRFSDAKIENSVIDNFKRNNNTNCLETVESKKYLRFKIHGKFKRYIYIKPSQYNKDHRVIIDIYNNENKINTTNIDYDMNDFIYNHILNKDNKSDLNLNDIIELSLNNTENKSDYAQYNTMDDTLNEIIDLRILEKEIRKEQNGLNEFLTNRLLNKEQKNIREIKKLVKRDYFIVIIDAGHGGKDPGTISKRNTQEKDINLDYAMILRKELTKNKKIKVYLTRGNDTFLSLTDRLNIARKYKPDLFISLHSNASSNKDTRGLSIYTLSKDASDTRTANLANSENKSNIIGGMNLYDEYQDTINTLVDLSRKEILHESNNIAEMFVKDFKRNNINLLEKPHRKANFAVLLAPDFPSVLIELGFLSNSKDDKMLNSNSYKKQFSKSIYNTINRIVSKM